MSPRAPQTQLSKSRLDGAAFLHVLSFFSLYIEDALAKIILFQIPQTNQ